MEWSSDYSIGVQHIDNEHHKLVNMITRLENSLKKGVITEQTGLVIKDLVDYTKYHFASEEDFMKKINYPDFELHKKQHVDLINSVIEILKDLKIGKPFTSVDLIEFLKSWLKNHIIDEDLRIGKYLSELLDERKK